MPYSVFDPFSGVSSFYFAISFRCSIVYNKSIEDTELSLL